MYTNLICCGTVAIFAKFNISLLLGIFFFVVQTIFRCSYDSLLNFEFAPFVRRLQAKSADVSVLNP